MVKTESLVGGLQTGHFRKKIKENGRPLYISHTEDFKKYFPDADFQSL